MKILYVLSFITIVFVSLSNLHSDADFNRYCDGWGDGYCEGWKDVKGQNALCPISPLCPVPNNDCNSGYRCGYNRGFKRGFRDAKNN
jgi:hypothetical protein